MKFLIIEGLQNEAVESDISGNAEQIVNQIAFYAEDESLGGTRLIFTRYGNIDKMGHEIVPELWQLSKESVMVEIPFIGCTSLISNIARYHLPPTVIEFCGIRAESSIIANAMICKSYFPKCEIIVNDKLCLFRSNSLKKSVFEILEANGIQTDPLPPIVNIIRNKVKGNIR